MISLVVTLDSPARKNGHTGTLQWQVGAQTRSYSLSKLLLRSNDSVRIGAETKTLGQWVELLATWKPGQSPKTTGQDPVDTYWNEGGQLALGTHLANQLFGRLNENDRTELTQAQAVRLVILARNDPDGFLARLPWVSLVWDRKFVAANGWSIGIASKVDFEKTSVEFPRNANLLVIAPEPAGIIPTGSRHHINELVTALSDGDSSYREGGNLRVVRSRRDLEESLRYWAPDVVYYYGHSTTAPGGLVRLVFQGSDGSKEELDIPTFCQRLTASKPSPLLVYVNCCAGDAAGPTGVGWQMSGRFPAVVTNRTVAFQDHARFQARTFLQRLIRESHSPEQAQQAVYQLAASTGFAFQSPQWMTPVLYVGYSHWKLRDPAPEDIIPHWPHLIDRKDQFGMVTSTVNTLLDSSRTKATAFLWSGGEKAGLEDFHKRLHVELEIHLRNNCTIVPISLVWPQTFPPQSGTNALFGTMFLGAMQVSSLDEIPARLRKLARAGGGKILAYFRHLPMDSVERLPPAVLKSYLQWWVDHVVEKLGPDQRGILGISYQVPDTEAAAFCLNLTTHHNLERFLPLKSRCECHVLPPLGLVPENELRTFFARYPFFRLPENREDEIVTAIIRKTGGHYAPLVQLLREVLRDGFPVDLDFWLKSL